MKFLKRLLPSPELDAMLGDITEEARRRSRLWYCGQLLAVLVVCSWRDVRKRPRLALRATSVGFATIVAYEVAGGIVFRVLDVLTNGGYYVSGYWLTLPNVLPDYPASMFVMMGINAFGLMLAGWAIARTHRGQGLAMALPFVVLMAPAPVASAAISTLLTRTNYVFVMHGLPVALLILWPPASILLGGILGTGAATPRERTTS
jgi:hypothetical protein